MLLFGEHLPAGAFLDGLGDVPGVGCYTPGLEFSADCVVDIAFILLLCGFLNSLSKLPGLPYGDAFLPAVLRGKVGSLGILITGCRVQERLCITVKLLEPGNNLICRTDSRASDAAGDPAGYCACDHIIGNAVHPVLHGRPLCVGIAHALTDISLQRHIVVALVSVHDAVSEGIQQRGNSLLAALNAGRAQDVQQQSLCLPGLQALDILKGECFTKHLCGTG